MFDGMGMKTVVVMLSFFILTSLVTPALSHELPPEEDAPVSYP